MSHISRHEGRGLVHHHPHSNLAFKHCRGTCHTQTVRYILGHPLQQHPRQDCMATPVRLIRVSMRVVEEYMTRVPSPRTLVF